MTDDTYIYPAAQQGTYGDAFDVNLMTADEWRGYYRAGRPSWRHPVQRIRWNLANVDFRAVLREHGVRV